MRTGQFPKARLKVEVLEQRDTPSAVTVQAGQTVRLLNDNVFGVNANSYDGVLTATPDDPADATPDPGTRDLLSAAGVRLVRLSNGSGSDEWHFAEEGGGLDFSSGAGVLANLTAAIGADGLVCVNFGTGTPEEAAAYAAYLNGSAANNAAIGTDANGTDWGTVASWAALRGQAPLAVDDGLNHLRASHPAAFGFHDFEVGNEAYFGAWQGYVMPDPQDYVDFTVAFRNLLQTRGIDPLASVGVGLGNPVEYDDLWNTPVLEGCAAAGFTPGFVSDHFYVYDGNSEQPLTDAQLLTQTVSDPTSTMPIHADAPRNWAGRAAAYRTLLNNTFGAGAASVRLLVGEFNSDADSATRQTTALTNGLFVADALGSMIQTEYQGAAIWNVRNEYTPNVPAQPGISGWRTGSDNGILGSRNNAAPPASGPYIAYPTYFAEQLASKLGVTGDTVVPVQSDTPTVAAYGVRQQNGHLALLLINKSPSAADTATVSVAGFTPAASAELWRYGQTEDNAQRDSADGAAALTHTFPALAVNGGQFQFTLPAYSMSLLDLAPAAAGGGSGGLFNPPVTITGANLGPDTTVLAVADFNGDGKQDFAVTNYGSANPNTVSVALGNGNGTFGAAVAYTVDASAGNRAPEGVATGDFDADGDQDLAVVLNEGSANNVVIMTNDGTGKFTAGQVLTAGTNATHIVAADLNNDGRPDLAVSNYGGGVSVFRNQPAGGFASAVNVSSGGTGTNVIVAADFDGDGDLDLAAANQIDGTVGVLRNSPTGVFASATVLDAGQKGTTFLAAGDLNEDGQPDLVASNTYHPPTNATGNTIRRFFNTGGGTFAAQPLIDVGPAPTGVVIRDFNGDQLPDVVVAASSTGEVKALMNNGGGTLLDPVPYAAITGANGLGVGDFNGDGRPDLAVTQYDSGDAVALLTNGLIGTTGTLAGPATSTAGATPTFTATVTPASGGTVTTGFVSFLDGDDYLTTVAVANGTASYSIPGLTAGAHSIRAIYSDAVDLTWFGDEATPLAHTVTTSTSTAAGRFAVGASNGSVRLVGADGTVLVSNFRPLDAGGVPYTGLVSVALGDLNGDTVPDVWVAAASPVGARGLSFNKAGKVFVYDGAALLAGTTPALLHTFTPFATTSGPGGTGGPYLNGLNIAAGDVDGNGSVELIAGTRGNVGAAGLVEYGRLVVVQAGTDADGSDDSNIGSTFTPFGAAYQKGVVVTAGDVDGDGAAEIAVTRGGPVAPSNPNKSIKLKVFRFTGQDLEELDLNGPAAGTFAPFQGVTGPGGEVLQRDARVAFVDPDGDGKHALVVTALDPLSVAGDVRVRVAAYTVDVDTGVATLASTGPGGGAPKSYLVGTGVLDHAIAAVGVSGGNASNLALITQSAASGVAYLDPLTGASLAGGFALSVLSGGVTIDGV